MAVPTTAASTTAAATNSFWQTIGASASTVGRYISATAVKVGQFVATYFRIALAFISRNDTACIWTVSGFAVGVVFTAVMGYFFYSGAKKDTTAAKVDTAKVDTAKEDTAKEAKAKVDTAKGDTVTEGTEGTEQKPS